MAQNNLPPQQPYNGQPYNGQPYNGQPYNGQPYNGQPYNGQPFPQSWPQQFPQPQQPPDPQNNPYAAWQTQAAFTKSFTTPAVICLILYIFLWIPGLIANIVYLVEANKVKTIIGTKPDGYGCLLSLLIIAALPFLIGAFIAMNVIVAGLSVMH